MVDTLSLALKTSSPRLSLTLKTSSPTLSLALNVSLRRQHLDLHNAMHCIIPAAHSQVLTMCTGAISHKDKGRNSQELHIQRVTIPKFIVIIDSLIIRYIEQQPNDSLNLRDAEFREQEWRLVSVTNL